MAHQLDFKITVWSANVEELLKLESDINTLSLAMHDMTLHMQFRKLIELLSAEFINSDGVLKLECHSVDINWDEEVDDV